MGPSACNPLSAWEVSEPLGPLGMLHGLSHPQSDLGFAGIKAFGVL